MMNEEQIALMLQCVKESVELILKNPLEFADARQLRRVELASLMLQYVEEDQWHSLF